MNDKIIEDILNEVASSTRYFVKEEEDFVSTSDFISYREHISLMCKNEWLLCKPLSNELTLLLSPFGKSVYEVGGWFRHLELEKEKVTKNEERQCLADKKIKYDLKNAQRIYNTYWWTFWFSVIALVISLVLAILKLIR